CSPTRTTLVFCRWRSRSPARCSSAMGARSRCEDAPTAGHSSSCGCPVDEWMEDDVVQQEKATKRVLIVDDEPGVRESVRMLLKEAYEPVAVSSAPEALSLLAAGPVDVVLLDIVMPGIDGLQLLEEVRARHPTLPVVML